ncbi:MAG: hypothetical protein GTO51_08295 [Candidatus Latescibacteria bacterium]|nr:hypothetical protein [Candidatus Latescibacterota bacterium]NIM21953.1 hypothetical protein [Candidatus Latescibacterota bacterium]NIM65971.1 hypothetical protein [Candidatus Latescibacterota bacterium]NIO02379.1 hypothetical protein [Candidatus Latescibacterota bacterium]NIO29289.1 hypothetical protein [Candidatus Latescibacterota bacterium]
MKKLLSKIWQGWKKVAHAIGVFNTKLLLGITYFIFLGMAAAITRVLRIDLLDKRINPKSTFWSDKEPVEMTLESSRRQF